MGFPPSTTNNEEQSNAALNSPELFVELVSLYFNYIHNIAHSVFHEPSFMHRLKHGKAPLVHVYAMCALAAR